MVDARVMRPELWELEQFLLDNLKRVAWLPLGFCSQHTQLRCSKCEGESKEYHSFAVFETLVEAIGGVLDLINIFIWRKKFQRPLRIQAPPFSVSGTL
jgi:hypothetical protein